MIDVDKDFEDAHYWHVLQDVVDLMKYETVDSVLNDIEYLLSKSIDEKL